MCWDNNSNAADWNEKDLALEYYGRDGVGED